jgi:hypothetical protein
MCLIIHYSLPLTFFWQTLQVCKFIVSQIGDVIAQRNCKQFLNISTANRQANYPLIYVALNQPNQNTDQDSGKNDNFCTSCDWFTNTNPVRIHGKLYTPRIMFWVITNIYNKKTKVPTLMELFTATGKLKRLF